MKKPNIEVEFKLTARDAAALGHVPAALAKMGVRARNPRREIIDDTYLDTEGWDIFHAGFACRIRRSTRMKKRLAVLTLKELAHTKTMLSRRDEYEEEIFFDPRRAMAGVNESLQGELGKKISSITGGKRLKRIFEITNRRRIFDIRVKGEISAEVCLDDFTLKSSRRQKKLAEVEIEVKKGEAHKLHEFVKRLAREAGLSMKSRPKFREGLKLAGLKPRKRK